MNLIGRYLQAVGYWLPKANREDFLRELSEDLFSQLETGEAALGRPLNDEEVSDLLIRTGNPRWVALQYQPPRTWLMQQLPRIINFLFQVVLLRIILPLFLVSVVARTTASDHPWASLAGMSVGFFVTTLTNLGGITLALVILDFWIQKKGDAWPVLARKTTPWNPRKLPKLETRTECTEVSRIASAISLVCTSIFTLWWAGILFSNLPLGWSHGQGFVKPPQWTLWSDFHAQWFTPILVLGVAWFVLYGTLLIQPRWMRLKLGFKVAANAALAAMLLQTLRTHREAMEMASTRLLELGEGVHGSIKAGLAMEAHMPKVLYIVVVFCLLSLIVNLFRLFNKRGQGMIF